MKLHTGLLLPLLAGAAYAIPDAKVYLFPQDEASTPSHPPALSPEEARLVFAQRLGVSQYHSLDRADDDALSYINRFGGRQKQPFEAGDHGEAAELVLFFEGASAKNADALLSAWPSAQPAFTIVNPPSSSENLELAINLDRQMGPDIDDCPFEENIDPDNKSCWKRTSKIIQVDLAAERPGINKVVLAQDRLIGLVKSQRMNVMVVLMPESSWPTTSKNAYGSYDKPPQKPLNRRTAEDPAAEAQEASSPVSKPKPATPLESAGNIRGVAPLCYTSLESCTSSTNNCSGHGKCYKKSPGTNAAAPCFACQCEPQYEKHAVGKKTGTWISYWGGGACQKEDVSGPFWLLAIFTVVLIGIVSWGIGMMYSIGEEKLPGVIGAGVSSKTV